MCMTRDHDQYHSDLCGIVKAEHWRGQKCWSIWKMEGTAEKYRMLAHVSSIRMKLRYFMELFYAKKGFLQDTGTQGKWKILGFANLPQSNFYISVRNKQRLTPDYFGNDIFLVNKIKYVILRYGFFYLKNEHTTNSFLWLRYRLPGTILTKYATYVQCLFQNFQKNRLMKRNVTGCVTFKIGTRRVVKGTLKELLVNGYLEAWTVLPHNMIKFPENTETKIDFKKSNKLNGVWSSTALGTNQTRTLTRTKRTKHSLNALQ